MAYDLQERNGRRARFTDLVDFIDRQARILSHPLFGNLKETSSTLAGRRTPGSLLGPLNIPRERKSGFTTSISPVLKGNGKPSGSALKCLFCQGEHKLDSCDELNEKPHQEKMDFLRNKGICFGCLSPGHMSKGCTQKITCRECSLKHPTILHIHKKAATCRERESNKRTVTSALVETPTGAGDPDCILSIVPVRVKISRRRKHWYILYRSTAQRSQGFRKKNRNSA